MRKLIPAVFALLAAGACHALGFGEMALHSALNQPLDATVELVAVKPSERESVDVRIPDAEMFERFGIARNPVLDDVRVEVSGRQGDRLRVTLSTRRPVREPFLTLLLEADWDGGRALREYTVLLDPPTEAPTTPAPPARAERDTTTPDTAATAPAETRTAAEQPAAAEEAPQASPETAPARAQAPEQRAPRAPAEEPGYRRYGPVAPDETLWSIAYELRPDPQISMDQMLLAIYQANPQAFDDNINLLNAGSTLVIPSADEIRAIDETAARQEIADQKRDYARSQGATRTAAAQQPEATPQAEPAGEAPPEDGELRLEPPTDDEGGTAAAEAAPADTGEEPAAGEQIAENAAATARALAEAAERAEQGEPAPSGEQAPEDGEVAAEASDTVTAEEDAAAAEGGPGAETPAPGDQPDGTEGDAGEVTTAEAERAGAPEETAPAAEEPTTEPAAEQEPAAEEPVGEAVPVGAESVIPEGTAGLLTSRNLLLALAALLLVVTIVMWLRRRQYKPVPADFSSQVASGVERDTGPSMEEDTTGTVPQSASAESVEEVLADADSYIEHELYDEALAALKVGMEQYPGDPALRRKALEVHYAAGARDAFLAAVEAYSPRPAADDPDWLAIAAMGRELAPDDPMFAESAPPERERTQPDTADASDTFDLERSFDSYFDDDEEAPAAPPAAEEAQRQSPPDLSWPEEEDEARPETGRATEPETDGFESSEFESTGSDETATDEVTSETTAGESTGGAGDDLDLDFDWSADTDEQPAAGEDFPETAETGEPRDEDTKADAGPPTLDIDLSEFDVGPDEERREAGPEETGQTAAADSGEDEFADFDFDSLSLDDDRPAERSGDEAPAEPADEPAEAERPEEDTVEKPELESSEDLGLDQVPVADDDSPEGQETTPSLEVDFGEAEAAPADAEEPPAESEAASEGDDEVTTKLDLARAYLDMGEPDMARSLLEEVKDQGNAEQRREAEELLERAG